MACRQLDRQIVARYVKSGSLPDHLEEVLSNVC